MMIAFGTTTTTIVSFFNLPFWALMTQEAVIKSFVTIGTNFTARSLVPTT
jgi:hypothetical protein